MRHPLVPVAISFGAGIWAASILPTPVWIPLGLTPAAAAGVMLLARRGRHRAAFAAAAMAFFFTGCAWYLVDTRVPAADLARTVGEAGALLRVRARVREVSLPPHALDPYASPGPTVVAAVSVQRGRDWVPATGRILLWIRGCGTHTALPGDVVEFLAGLRRPREARAPGEYDRREALEREGVRLEATVSSSRLKIVHEGPKVSVLRQAARLRGFLAGVLREHLPRRESELFVALLLGHRPGIDPEDRARFAESGMGHLLAVSGLHLAILAGLAGLCLRSLGLGRRTTAIALAAFACLYAVVAGARPPVVRAAVMVVTYLASMSLGRDRDLPNGVALAALVLLFHRPAWLLDPGFQLSFAAVAFIAFLYPVMEEAWCATRGEPADWMEPLSQNRYDRAVRRLRQALFVSVAAWIGVQPLVLHYLGFVNPWAIPANVVVLPLATVALASGVAFLAAGALWTAMGSVLALPARAGLGMLMWAVRAFAALPASQVHLPSPGRWWLLGYYGFALVAVVWASDGVKTLRPASEREYDLAHTMPARWVTSRATRRAMLAAVVALAAAALVFAFVGREAAPAPSVTVFDLGRHRAVAVRTAGGADVLVNAGSPGRATALRDRLREGGFAPPAVVAVTRDDEDRTSGLAAVLDETTGALLALPSGRRSSGGVLTASASARERRRGPVVVWPRPGDEFTLGAGRALRWVPLGRTNRDRARGPTVLHLSAGRGLEVVFYEQARFGRRRIDREDLSRAGLPTGAVLVVLDAHGAGEAADALARALEPRLVIFQRSETEAVFPGQAAAHSALVQGGVTVLVTEGRGTLRVEVDDGGLLVRRWREGKWERVDR